MADELQVRGQQLEQLVEALVDAYPDTDSLARMLEFRLARQLARFAALPKPLDQVVFEVIAAANSQGWTMHLIAAARESRPSNPKLLKLGEDFGLTATTAQLERKVRDDLSYVDIADWRSRLGAIEGQVCRLETPGSMGTGFLLGPDVVITNYHVMEEVIKNPACAANVVIRFDYKRLANGTTVNEGTTCRLAAESWLLDYSPYSPADLIANPNSEVPNTDELDYALLRLDSQPGAEPIAGPKAEPGAPKRSWITIDDATRPLAVDAPLFIVQHPQNWPLKLAMDTRSVLSTNSNGTRVRYRTNTEKGSSGSPVFNEHWQLVALHHSGDRAIVPVYNQGIPIAAIVGLLRTRGKMALLNQPCD
jgi:hypothetical protein